ncbi:MAG: sulfatase-like hydrolase/transferase [Bacteroidales bacterium]|nr:sulfatase-like hydrolase/transferase [Bacteroidales bacterium]
MGKRARKKGTKRRTVTKRSGKKGFTGNMYVAMTLKLLMVLLLMFLSRILFYLFNLSYFHSIPFTELIQIFIAGLRFDLSVLLILNLPFILMNSIPFKFRVGKGYQGFANGLFYIINSLVLLTNFIDIVYFRFTLKRMTSDIFKFIEVGGDFDRLLPQFIKDFWYVQLLWIGFVLIMILVCRKIRIKDSPPRTMGFRYYAVHSVIFAVIIFLVVTGFRGGFQLRPISLVTAGKYTSTRDVPLVLNTPFAIVKTFTHSSLERKAYFSSEADLEKVYSPLHSGMKSGFKPYNVLIIVMESFSREHIGFLNKHLDNGRYRGFTPVFDSLIQRGTYVEGFANEKTSIKAIPAILSSIPSLMNDALTQSTYSGNRYTSIAGLLKPKGYSTAFFHGGTNGTMGYDMYTRVVGFDHYFGRTEYNDERDYDGKWGIRDEEFFQYSAQRMNELKQPFVALLYSLSAHHPYFVPGKYRHVFREGKLPIQQSIMYSDFALGRFMDTIQRMPWYRNTIIVITADHTSEGYYPYYKGPVGQYAIPILILFPDERQRGIYREIAQQTDILPTILSYMGYDKDYIAFGTDMMDRSAPHFSIHYVSGIYTLIKEGYVLEFNGSESLSLYDVHADVSRKQNLVSSHPEVRQQMEQFIKAYIQQYNNRMIENRLLLP